MWSTCVNHMSGHCKVIIKMTMLTVITSASFFCQMDAVIKCRHLSFTIIVATQRDPVQLQMASSKCRIVCGRLRKYVFFSRVVRSLNSLKPPPTGTGSQWWHQWAQAKPYNAYFIIILIVITRPSLGVRIKCCTPPVSVRLSIPCLRFSRNRKAIYR